MKKLQRKKHLKPITPKKEKREQNEIKIKCENIFQNLNTK